MFQYTKEESDMCKGEFLEFTEHVNMSMRTKRYLRLDAYVVAIWNVTQISLNLCNFGRKLYTFHQV